MRAPHQNSLNKAVPVEPRRLKWDFSRSKKYWCDGSPILTHTLNVYTLLVPENERYYIRTLNRHIGKLSDESQLAELQQFFRQESLHGVAHQKYWEKIRQYIPDVDAVIGRLNYFLYRILEPAQPDRLRVAFVSAIEHVNATWAHAFLSEDLLSDSDPELKRLFYWHFAEEIEHKNVAFRALESIYPSYFLRVFGFLLAVSVFYAVLVFGTFALLRRDNQLLRMRHISDLYKFFITRRFLRHNVKESLRYLKPAFRPWDLDDLHLATNALEFASKGNVEPVPDIGLVHGDRKKAS